MEKQNDFVTVSISGSSNAMARLLGRLFCSIDKGDHVEKPVLPRLKRMGKIEREVIFCTNDGSIVAKETKFRRGNGRAGFLVKYLVDGKWTYRSAEASSEAVEMVRKYRDSRCKS